MNAEKPDLVEDCMSCKFRKGYVHPETKELLGICQRYPPQVMMVGSLVDTPKGPGWMSQQHNGQPPAVRGLWCGEYQPKKTFLE